MLAFREVFGLSEGEVGLILGNLSYRITNSIVGGILLSTATSILGTEEDLADVYISELLKMIHVKVKHLPMLQTDLFPPPWPATEPS